MVIQDFVSFVQGFSENVLQSVFQDLWFEHDGGFLPTALFLSAMILGFGVYLIRRALYNR